MTNKAIVEKIENNYVIVSTVRKGACGENCSMCGGCNAQKVYTKAFCDIDVKTGDIVKLESNTHSVILAMLVIFILPLVLPISLYLLFMNYGVIFSVLSALSGVIISCVVIYNISHSNVFIKSITPKIVAIENKK